MEQALLLALGLVLMVEGLGPLFFPKKWRSLLAQLASLPKERLRRIGGCLFFAGLVIVLMITN